VAVRKKRGLALTDLGFPESNAKVFINWHLTVANKLLYKKTREIAKIRLYQYVWVKHCKIFVRKNTGSPNISVRKLADIEKIK
jgi:hypothetical protein